MNQAKLFFWGARALYVGPAFGLSPHRNAVAVLCAGISGDFALALGASAAASKGHLTCRTALIPANTLHHLKANAEPMAFLYVDAQGDDYRHLRARAELGALAPESEATYLAALAALHGGQTWREAREQLASALDLPVPARPDERIAEIVRCLHENPGDPNDLAHFAQRAGLSPSRFLHLFKDATGVPFRRYRLWARMGGAVRSLVKGGSLTDVALDAGFSSSSHFSSAFRDMFGMSPSRLAGFNLSIVESAESRAAPR